MTAPGYDELDTVVLLHDIPEAGLRVGDLGTLVHLHTPDSFDVEFVLASGRTQALLKLGGKDVRPVREDDLMGVRQANPAAGVVDGTRP